MESTLCLKAMELYSPLGWAAKWYVRVRLKMSPLDEVADLCPEEGTIYDLGCGTGLFAHMLRLGSDKRRIFATDLSEKRIEIARKTAPPSSQLTFEAKNALEADLSNADCITIVDLLHHMPYPLQDELLRKAAGALPPGGILVLKDLDKRPLWKYWFHYMQDSISYRGGRLYFRASEDFIKQLQALGFDVEVHPPKRRFPYPHIAFRCVKREKSETEQGK